MSTFQILIVCCGVGLLAGTVAGAVRRTFSRRVGAFWSLVWLAMIVAVIDPSRITRIARALGIGRGADLLLYVSVVVMLVGFVMVYARLHRLRRDVTLLVRELAVRGAERQAGDESERDA